MSRRQVDIGDLDRLSPEGLHDLARSNQARKGDLLLVIGQERLSSRRLQEIILKACHADLRTRYQSASDLEAELRLVRFNPPER